MEWIEDSPSLRALNAIAVTLLSVGGVITAISIIVALSPTQPSTAAAAAIWGYVGGALFGFGASTGVLALAVNAIVGAIARARVDEILQEKRSRVPARSHTDVDDL